MQNRQKSIADNDSRELLHLLDVLNVGFRVDIGDHAFPLRVLLAIFHGDHVGDPSLLISMIGRVEEYQEAIPIILECIGIPIVPVKTPIDGTDTAFDTVDADLIGP